MDAQIVANATRRCNGHESDTAGPGGAATFDKKDLLLRADSKILPSLRPRSQKLPQFAHTLRSWRRDSVRREASLTDISRIDIFRMDTG